MKKFLSLVLALVMTMSLVTVGAGAAEYKDLTDKSEIQYEEAVAVLNKIGIITGYEDGSFKPTGALTRGAAAKIIVSLMIGSEAASNLTVTAAPYSDVPVTNTFAGVISYCKTAGYINGYADGTFRPTAPLTGYAFTKMLLGALGYDGKIEGFTGSGWTMNVAKLGNVAGLFDDFKTSFKGNDGVTREAACLLALNTLKATEVEYTGGANVTAGDASVTINATRELKTSNNKNINQNIGKVKANSNGEFTLEFGEDHFADLKLTAEGSASDDFGRPANEWSYKNVKIGTYALTPDYVYTTGASGDTDNDKIKDMGLKDFTIESYTNLTVNGLTKSGDLTVGKTTLAANAKTIAGYTDNGVLVEVYMNDKDANAIESIVVVKTQLMQVNSVKSSEVTLKKLDDVKQNAGTSKETEVPFMSVNSVKDDDDAFTALKSLKADDYVLVVPVTTNEGSSYTVDSVAIPQTVTGKMTNITTKSADQKVKAITVAGTSYKMSNMWTSEDDDLNVNTKLSATVDSTVYLDTYGYAIYVTGVTSSNSAIIIDELYSAVESGKIVTYAKGWNTNGESISLNLGTQFSSTTYGAAYTSNDKLQGTVWEYETSNSNSADYALVKDKGTAVTSVNGKLTGDALVYTPTQQQWIKNGQYQADVLGKTAVLNTNITNNETLPMASDVKFIFLSGDGEGGDITGITVRTGVTSIGDDKGTTAGTYEAPADPANVQASEDVTYKINYVLNSDKNKVIAVVVANDDDAAVTANLIYVDTVNEHWIDANDSNKTKVQFKAYDAQGNLLDNGASKYNKETLTGSSFYTYTKDEATGVYSLTPYTKTTKTTSVNFANNVVVNDKAYFTGAADGGNQLLNAKGAAVVDLYTDDGLPIASMNDMKTAIADGKAASFNLAYIYNGNDDTTGYRTVSLVLVLKTNGGSTGASGSSVSYNAGEKATVSMSGGVYAVNVTIREDSDNTVDQMAKKALEDKGFINVNVVDDVAMAVMNGQNFTFDIKTTKLFKVTLTLTETLDPASLVVKLGDKQLKSGDSIYADATTGVELTVTGGSSITTTPTNCTVSSSGSTYTVKASDTGATLEIKNA